MPEQRSLDVIDGPDDAFRLGAMRGTEDDVVCLDAVAYDRALAMGAAGREPNHPPPLQICAAIPSAPEKEHK